MEKPHFIKRGEEIAGKIVAGGTVAGIVIFIADRVLVENQNNPIEQIGLPATGGALGATADFAISRGRPDLVTLRWLARGAYAGLGGLSEYLHFRHGWPQPIANTFWSALAASSAEQGVRSAGGAAQDIFSRDKNSKP